MYHRTRGLYSLDGECSNTCMQVDKGFRQINNARLWVAMDRWFLCKRFLVWLVKHNFDWVPRPSGTLSCSGKSTTPGNKKKSTLS